MPITVVKMVPKPKIEVVKEKETKKPKTIEDKIKARASRNFNRTEVSDDLFKSAWNRASEILVVVFPPDHDTKDLVRISESGKFGIKWINPPREDGVRFILYHYIKPIQWDLTLDTEMLLWDEGDLEVFEFKTDKEVEDKIIELARLDAANFHNLKKVVDVILSKEPDLLDLIVEATEEKLADEEFAKEDEELKKGELNGSGNLNTGENSASGEGIHATDFEEEEISGDE